MRSLYFFWIQLNWLEFVVYILFPVSILAIILVYIYFNIQYMKLSYDVDLKILKFLDDNFEKNFCKIKKNLTKIENSDNIPLCTIKKHIKEKI